MNSPHGFSRLSQGHLNVLSACPRQFQYKYLDKILHPLPIEQQDNLEWGSQFHLLMQQRELGLPVEEFLGNESLFKQCLQGLINSNPLLFANPTDEGFRESEHQRTIEFNDYFLTVIYDLVILERDEAQIIDWKTYAKPQSHKSLKRNWQSRLYPFVLLESSSYRPAQISMTYWFVKSKKSLKIVPESTDLQYNEEEYKKTKSELEQLLNQLTQWLEDYRAGIDLPQVPLSSSQCTYCPFALRCDRLSLPVAPHSLKLSIPPLETIPETPI